MTYKTGSITSATPAKALVDLLDPDLTGVGFVRVETGHTAGGVTWNVYRSPAASNFFGSDWYFALGYDTTGQTTLYSCVMEDWDATNKLAIRFAPNTASLVPGAGYINPQAPAALPAGFTLSHALPTTAFTYAYSTLIDRVAIGVWTTSAGRMGWYVGLYDSFYSTTDDPFPLCLCLIGQEGNSSSQVASRGASTREPMTTLATQFNFYITQGASSGFSSWSQSAINNVYQGNRPWVSRVMLGGRGGWYDVTNDLRAPRGLFRDLFICSANLGTNGDRITWSANGQSFAGVVYQTTGTGSGARKVLIPEY